MTAALMIAGWVLGSVLLGLLLGAFLSAERRRFSLRGRGRSRGGAPRQLGNSRINENGLYDDSRKL